MVAYLQLYAYYEALFGESEGEELINVFGIVYVIVGLPSLVGYGLFVDRFGPVLSLVVMDVLAVIFAVAFLVPHRAAQLVAQVIFSGLMNCFYMLTPPLTQLYSPPELFGTVFGGLFALIGALQIFVTGAEDFVAKRITSEEKSQVVGCLLFWTVSLVPAAIANLWLWRRQPPPKAGEVSMADIREARAAAGARHLKTSLK